MSFNGICFAVLLNIFLAGSACAGSFSARIQAILLCEDCDLVYVYPVGGVQNPPACHGSNGNYTSFKMSRPRAKEYLAALLLAQAGGKTIAFFTAGSCIDQPMSDTLRYFQVDSQ